MSVELKKFFFVFEISLGSNYIFEKKDNTKIVVKKYKYFMFLNNNKDEEEDFCEVVLI